MDKDEVRRVLAKYYKPEGGSGPSWLATLGHAKDSLWSIDLFRCESILLWVFLVMDQHTRRIIGFGVQAGHVDGPAVCRMFSAAVAGVTTPTYLSSDNDPLFLYHRWQATLRVLEIGGVKSIPHVPMSHPFVERLIGTIRREYLDQIFFWNQLDLEKKLVCFRDYYNDDRIHSSLAMTPTMKSGVGENVVANLADYRWKKTCGGLVSLPVAA